MLAVRFFRRMLLIVFIVRAAAVRQRSASYGVSPLQFGVQPRGEDEEKLDAAEGFNYLVENNGNALPKTEITWEIAPASEVLLQRQQQRNHYPARIGAHPAHKQHWRITHRRYDKMRQRIQVEQLRAYINSRWNAKSSPNNDEDDYAHEDEREPEWSNTLPASLKELFQKRTSKRQWDRGQPEKTEPSYQFAYVFGREPAATMATRTYQPGQRKREQLRADRPNFQPSISAGAMTNLADFFNDLSTNVLFTEHSQLGQAETKLLEGNHPLGMANENDIENDNREQTYPEKTAHLLQAIRAYTPSQKVRTLVSRNPQGYRSPQFIDPSYMWVGLGK